jgi:hypothetical protein
MKMLVKDCKAELIKAFNLAEKNGKQLKVKTNGSTNRIKTTFGGEKAKFMDGSVYCIKDNFFYIANNIEKGCKSEVEIPKEYKYSWIVYFGNPEAWIEFKTEWNNKKHYIICKDIDKATGKKQTDRNKENKIPKRLKQYPLISEEVYKQKTINRYSKDFKEKIIKDIEIGLTFTEARKKYNIKGMCTIQSWIKVSGKNHLLYKINVIK